MSGKSSEAAERRLPNRPGVIPSGPLPPIG
jgi:hypothetical protein